MLRKLVAVTGAVFLAVGLATASAVASEMPELSVANRGHGAKPPPLAPTPSVPSPDTPDSSPPDSPGLPPDDSGPGGPPADSGPPPPAMPPAAPPPPDVPVESPSPAPAPPPPPEEVRPAEKLRPPAGFSEEAPTRLPQTGSGVRPLTATGGASLLGAGLAVIAGARQKKRAATPPGP